MATASPAAATVASAPTLSDMMTVPAVLTWVSKASIPTTLSMGMGPDPAGMDDPS